MRCVSRQQQGQLRKVRAAVLLAILACLPLSLEGKAPEAVAVAEPVRAIPVAEALFAAAKLQASAVSDSGKQPIYFKLPAPRGQILDRLGRPLAQTKVAYRLTRTAIKADSEKAFLESFEKDWAVIVQHCPFAVHPDVETLRAHWKDRAQLPITISGTREAKEVTSNGVPLPAFLRWQAVYVRYYPEKSLASHTLGYVTETGSPLKGALLHEEPLWMEVEGRAGLEKTFDQRLRGEAGLLLRTVDSRDYSSEDTVITSPKAGADLITTLDLEVQKAVETALASAKKPGAAVVVSADTGDILAIASWPTFDGNAFAGGISSQDFEALLHGEGNPMFHRAVSGEYPPGSIFKPVVALAGLRSGGILDWQSLPCGPTLEIEGRVFKNWSDTDQGMLPLRGALIRSCNTYFYQAGINTGDVAIISAARELGFGSAPALPLPSVSKGLVPNKAVGMQAVANLSIGQGDLLVTPVQAAVAMASIVNARVLLRPRLVAQAQTQAGQVTAVSAPCRESLLRFPDEAMESVRHAMYGVVNHSNGTAGRARLPNVAVSGKTGTAQWMTEGKERAAVWFAGFVDQSNPRLAFAVVLEADDTSGASGGRLAAPVVGQFLGKVFPQRKAAAKEVAVTYHGAVPIVENDPLFFSDYMAPQYADFGGDGFYRRDQRPRSQAYESDDPNIIRRLGQAFGFSR